MEVRIDPSWKVVLQDEFDKPYFAEIVKKVKAEVSQHTVFPPGPLIFHAFDKTPFDKVRVVILGQDPYHGVGQAHGLCFSVPRGVRVPASLSNVFREIESDLGLAGFGTESNGNLEHWAEQGVFLLNSILTVRAGVAASHKDFGWQTFTDAVIKKISDEKRGVVFLLWGSYARSKKPLIDIYKHYIFEAPHPSPLARGAFNGCRHFSKTNEVLRLQGLPEIDWTVK